MMMKVLLSLFLAANVSGKAIIDVAYLLEGKEGGETTSRSRHLTWHEESEKVLNEHIALEQAAAVQYKAMYAYFARDAVHLKNTAKFFADNANEEWGHASELMAYQIKRGGKVQIFSLDAPVHDFAPTETKSDARVAFESALAMEKKVYDSLLRLHTICGTRGDPSCQDHIDAYLADQINAIDNIARYVADLNRVGNDGHAVWEWDNELA